MRDVDRKYSIFDKVCLGIDQALRALNDTVKTTGVAYPAESIQENEMADNVRIRSSALMRVNHAGEICAQALYHGQAFISKTPKIRAQMEEAALEEGNHLMWCKRRLNELGSHTSYLNPFWYTGSFCIGVVAGMISDKWSLGFLAETERQVIKHIEGHLSLLKIEDPCSYKVLQQMSEDEAKHRDQAIALGGYDLPSIVKQGMRLSSKIMVKTAYWI